VAFTTVASFEAGRVAAFAPLELNVAAVIAAITT
jgi:hypothetical protein